LALNFHRRKEWTSGANGVDAQREACAFILSQKHEGWTVLPALTAPKVSPGWDFREGAKFPCSGILIPCSGSNSALKSLQGCVGNFLQKVHAISVLYPYTFRLISFKSQKFPYYGATATRILAAAAQHFRGGAEM